MSDPIVTTGRVKNGRLTVRNANQFADRLKRCRDGEVTITVDRKRATRSLNQNAWYWGQIVQLLSEHTGYTPDEMHEALKAKFLPKRLSVQDGNGVIVDELVIGGTTAKLNTSDFAEYCESIRRWAATDLDVNIPDPE